MFHTHILAIGILLFSIISSYSIGALVIWGCNKQSKNSLLYDTYIKIIIGVLTITLVYSGLKTGGNTIHTGFIITAILYWWQYIYKKKKKDTHQISFSIYFFQNWKYILILFIVSMVWYSFYSSMYYSGPCHTILHFDEVYYSFLSSKFGIWGVETDAPLYEGHTTGASPYHYIELWLTNALSSLFSVNPLLAISVLVKSFFSGVLVLGMFALTQLFTKNVILYILAFFSITIGAIVLDYSPAIQMATNAHQVKMLIVALFFIWFIILHHQNRYSWFYPLLLLPFINIATLPVIASSLCFYSFILFLKHKKKQAYHIIVPTIVTAMFVALFYGFQSTPQSAPIYGTAPSLYERFLPFYSFHIFVYDTIKYIKHYLLYAPYFLPIIALSVYYYIQNKTQFLKLWNSHKFLILFFSITVICGYILSFLMYPIVRYDNMQLITLTSTVLLNIFVFLSFLYVFSELQNNSFYKTAVILFIGATMLYNIYVFYSTKRYVCRHPESERSKSYITNVSNYFSEHTCSVYGARLQDTSEFSNKDKASTRSELINAYWFSPLSTQIDFLYTTSLNTTYTVQSDAIQLPLTNPEKRLDLFWEQNTPKTLAQAPFSVFAHSYLMKNAHTTIDTLQYLFVKKHMLNYLVLSKPAKLPDIFLPMVDTIFIDSCSGERFVFLKRE